MRFWNRCLIELHSKFVWFVCHVLIDSLCWGELLINWRFQWNCFIWPKKIANLPVCIPSPMLDRISNLKNRYSFLNLSRDIVLETIRKKRADISRWRAYNIWRQTFCRFPLYLPSTTHHSACYKLRSPHILQVQVYMKPGKKSYQVSEKVAPPQTQTSLVRVLFKVLSW